VGVSPAGVLYTMNDTMTKHKTTLVISIPPEYKARLKIKAIKENKTVAKLIRDWLDKDEGYYDNGVHK
jgi:hypothetical protein